MTLPELESNLYQFLPTAIWQPAIICAVAGLCGFAIRLLPARQQFGLWLLVLLLCLTVPLASVWSVRWHIGAPDSAAIQVIPAGSLMIPPAISRTAADVSAICP